MIISPYKGKLYLKVFWRGAYENKHCTPIKRLLGGWLGARYYPSLYICQDQAYKIVDNVANDGKVKSFRVPDVTEKAKAYLRDYNLKFSYVFWDDIPPSDGVYFGTDLVSNIDGVSIGNCLTTFNLLKKGIIHFEPARPEDNICSIGYSPKQEKWFGWSHRAICGFGIGYVAREGDCTTTSGYVSDYIKEHPELNRSLSVGFKCRNMEDCKKAAIAYADSVS